MGAAKLTEIENWLNAYRHGWVAYDRNHVEELQRQRSAARKKRRSLHWAR